MHRRGRGRAYDGARVRGLGLNEIRSTLRRVDGGEEGHCLGERQRRVRLCRLHWVTYIKGGHQKESIVISHA